MLVATCVFAVTVHGRATAASAEHGAPGAAPPAAVGRGAAFWAGEWALGWKWHGADVTLSAHGGFLSFSVTYDARQAGRRRVDRRVTAGRDAWIIGGRTTYI